MKYSYQHIIAVTAFILLAFTSCKKEKSPAHNANSPISINSFTPEVGGGGTEILITGDNFSTDTSQIAVTLNGRKLKIIGANTTQMMVVVPKKVGTGPIVVTIGKGTATS